MIRLGRYYPSDKVLDVLAGTLDQLQESSDMTAEEAGRIRSFALHLIAEYSAVKQVPLRLPSKPYRPTVATPTNSI